ncbi:MAG: zinc ribbon domain-containing protein [Thermodesulfobacteriota bacterium]
MPIYEVQCRECGRTSEVLVLSSREALACPSCGSLETQRMMSKTSSYGGRSKTSLPGPGDHSCCGVGPASAGCAGPGSCCGKG